MRPSFLLLSFALVVVSHGDPTALDDDDRPADDTSTPAPTTNSTPAPRPTADPDDSRSGFWARRLARCKKASSRCVWTVAIFLVFSIALVTFLVAVACTLCYAMNNKRQQRQKLVPCDAYCTCPAHANQSSHFATRLESA